jgi:hypothetical protein
MNKIIKRTLITLLTLTTFYYTAKFFHCEGEIHAVYFYGKIWGEERCELVQKLWQYELGHGGTCLGLYIPEDKVIWQMVLEDTFTTFP